MVKNESVSDSKIDDDDDEALLANLFISSHFATELQSAKLDLLMVTIASVTSVYKPSIRLHA